MLAPKKTIALQARWGPPNDVAPVLGESEADTTALSAGLALPAVVFAQPAMEVISLPTSKQAELLATLVASTMTGMA